MPSLHVKKVDSGWLQKVRIAAMTRGMTVHDFVVAAVNARLLEKVKK